jgi:hypothetical protein
MEDALQEAPAGDALQDALVGSFFWWEGMFVAHSIYSTTIQQLSNNYSTTYSTIIQQLHF